MTAPTASEIRSWSQVDFGALGFADPSPAFDELVARAEAFFGEVTGLGFGDPAPDPLAAPDARLEPLVRQAVQRMVELVAFQAQPDYAETLADFQLLSSFSAGTYSESRRSLTELRDAKMIVGDPALNGLLWALMTPEKRSFWLAWLTGANEPAFEVTEVDWGAGERPWWAPYPWGPWAVDWPRELGGF